MSNPLGVSPSKRETGNHTRQRKKSSFDLGGNRTHDLWIRSTVTLPTELQGRTEKVGDESWRQKKSVGWEGWPSTLFG